MKREGDDIFLPTALPATASPEAVAAPDFPHGLSCEEVIQLLEPMTKGERRKRFQAVLEQRKKSVSVVLDNPHDPHNGSAIMRSCDAFGVTQVHVLTQQEPFLASRVVAKGSQRWLDVIEHQTPDALADHLKKQGYQLYVTHPDGEADLEKIKNIPQVAFIMGNERDGVSQALASAADGRVRIDMCGFVESLNVSVSAAILLQAATQNRKGDLNETEKQRLYARWLVNSVPRAEEILRAYKA